MKAKRLLSVLVLVLLSPAILYAQASRDTCAPTQQHLSAGATAAGLAGTYRITLVATVGPRAGKKATGALVLHARDSASRYVNNLITRQRIPYLTEPYFGFATFAPDSIGATPNGAIDRDDSLRPGVVLRERHPAPEHANTAPVLKLLFGQQTTRRDQMTLDGPYFFATIRVLQQDGFRGDWYAEIGPSTYRVWGYFCARPPNSQLLPTSGITHSGGAPRKRIAPTSPRSLARSDAGGRMPR